MTYSGSSFHPTFTVGYDESAPAQTAIRWAAAAARDQGATLRIVTVWDPSPITPWTLPDLTEWREQARTEAETAATAVRSILGDALPAQSLAIEGRPGPVLVDQSRTSDLMVVGSSGHLGLAGLLSGSVSRHCLHRACCPVVVVGPQMAEEGATPTRRVVLSSTLDPDGETQSWVARWLARQPLPVHVIASYEIPADLPELAQADTPTRIRASVQEQNHRWMRHLRGVVGPSVSISGEVVYGTTLEVLRRHTEPGDLLVVPSGCEHSAPFADASVPIMVVPQSHHAHAHAREPALTILETTIAPAAVV